MPSSQKRKRSYSATPQWKQDFQVLNDHDPWKASSQQNLASYNYQVTPRSQQVTTGGSQRKTFTSPQTLSSGRDHSNTFQDVNIQSQYTKSQSHKSPSSQKSSKDRKREKKRQKRRSNSGSSPLVPNVTSTPHHSQKTKPVPIPIPVDPRLDGNYIRAQAEAVRQRAREAKANETFTSHVSSSASASETSSSKGSTDTGSSEEDSSSEESDGTPSPKPKEPKSKKTKSKKPDKDAKAPEKRNKKGKKSKKDPKDLTETVVEDVTRKKKSKSESRKEKTTLPPTANPPPTTKQTNQTLESDLFTTLTTAIPAHLMSQARAALTAEVQSKAKTLHEATPYSGNSSGPSDRAVTLRAAYDLLRRLSVHRIMQGSANGGTNPSGYVSMESDLGRIAAERGKRIELLEMENRGLKGQIERTRVQVDGADDNGDGGEDGDEDEGRREKKKRRMK